jgi:hypothetical protein
LSEEAELIMKKCKGLPLAIVTIGGFLAKQPKTPMEWKKLNSHISAELEINQGLGNIKNVLSKSYDGLPYHLKHCFLYLSIFPEDHDIERGRLVRRWIAEGYSTEVHGKPLKEIADSHFIELIDRSMILPNKKSYFSGKGIDSCQVHDLLREISISKAVEENLVFRLEEGCSSNTYGTIRHLTISANWEGDQNDFRNTVDVSRIRSLTVFGKWRPFYISDKMRFLRVLDLQDSRGLCDHHIEHIGKLLHLRYLSLRGCRGVYHLPDSVGNMKQLQTLDIRGTWIMVPKTIIKLKQLQYLRVGGINSLRCFLFHSFLRNCAAFCAHQSTMWLPTETWHDRCAECWCVTMPALARPFSRGIYSLPRGAGNLKALHTLGEVDIGSGHTLKELKRLTWLRKLKVEGINKKNCHEFCATLEVLRYLESLSVFIYYGQGSMHGCLDAVSSPPNNLHSLKLYGNLVQLPAWIMGLRNLVKVLLEFTELSDSDGTMRFLGNLPYLTILELSCGSFDVEGLHLDFLPQAFPSLVALQLTGTGKSIGDEIDIKSVQFKDGAAPKLEMLKFGSNCYGRIVNAGLFSGLASLPSLRKFELSNIRVKGSEAFVEDVRAQLAQNPNRPVLIER